MLAHLAHRHEDLQEHVVHQEPLEENLAHQEAINTGASIFGKLLLVYLG